MNSVIKHNSKYIDKNVILFYFILQDRRILVNQRDSWPYKQWKQTCANKKKNQQFRFVNNNNKFSALGRILSFANFNF